MGEIDPKLGELMKKTRIERRLTQEEVAELIDCHPQYYKNLENSHGMPSIPMLCKILKVLDIPADDYVRPNQNKDRPLYKALLMLLRECDEYMLSVMLATAEALIKNRPDKENNKAEI